jgi:hypothetical protein
MSKRKTKPKPPPTLLDQIRAFYDASGHSPIDLKRYAGLEYKTAWRYHHDDRKPDALTLNAVFEALDLEVISRHKASPGKRQVVKR